VGSFVVYSGTGTRGKITEIMSDNEGIWALIDKTISTIKPILSGPITCPGEGN